jgi:hypothetical protein
LSLKKFHPKFITNVSKPYQSPNVPLSDQAPAPNRNPFTRLTFTQTRNRYKLIQKLTLVLITIITTVIFCIVLYQLYEHIQTHYPEVNSIYSAIHELPWELTLPLPLFAALFSLVYLSLGLTILEK